MNTKLNGFQRKIIALLLASREMISIEALRKLTGLSGKEIKEEIEKINEVFEMINFPAKIVQVENFLGLYLNPEDGKSIFQYLEEITRTKNLSKAALETLAIIAFKGPITRKEIMKIRGVSPDSSLATLLEYELIDRFENNGKTYYKITKKFLKSVGLSSEKDLQKLIKDRIIDE